MTSSSGESTAQVPSSVFEFGVVDFQNNSSAHAYFQHLMKYLKNVTIGMSRPRPHDIIPLDKCSGILWVIIVPIIYFVAVGLILAFLLSISWYTDDKSVGSATQSEASIASPCANNVRHNTVVVSDTVNQSIRHSIVLNYLTNTAEFHKSFKKSKNFKESSRSLNILTEKDLQCQYSTATSLQNKKVTEENKRPSMSFHECFGNNRGNLGEAYFQRPTTSRGSYHSLFSPTSDLKLSDLAVGACKNDESFSTDSLEKNMSRDSLWRGMESHKYLCRTNGETLPEDLNGSIEDTHESRQSKNLKDSRKCIPGNRTVLSDKFYVDQSFFFRDTDDHLKRTYEAAVILGERANTPATSQHIDVPYRESTNSIQNVETPVFRLHVYETTNACANDSHKQDSCKGESHWKTSKRRLILGLNADSNVHRMSLHTDVANSTMSRNVDCDNVTLCTGNGGHFLLSSRQTEMWESNEEANNSANNFEDEGKYQPLQVDTADDINTTSVSQRVGSSQEELDHTQECSSPNGRDDDSQCSATNSLPSSIAGYHTNKVGFYPSPAAGYPLYWDENISWNKTNESDNIEKELQYDSHGNQTDMSSLRANFDSYSQSSSAIKTTLSLQENSLSSTQGGVGECCHDNSNSAQGFVKLSKRPSPLSSFVNNLRKRYSLDENLLKIKSSGSGEEEALISSSPIHQESETKKRRSKRQRVTVEERLHEFGFLKYNGKNKYIINPSPGKFEIGSGYFNYVFNENEDVPLRTRSLEYDSKQCLTPDMQIFSRGDNRQVRMTLSDKCRPKPTIAQHIENIERFTHLHQHKGLIEESINQITKPTFLDEEGNCWEDGTPSANVQIGREVIEIHNEPNQVFTEMYSHSSNIPAEQNIRIGNVVNFANCRTPPYINRNENNVINSGTGMRKIERRQAQCFQHKEKFTLDTDSHFQIQPEKRDGINEAPANIETYHDSLTTFSNVYQAECSLPPNPDRKVSQALKSRDSSMFEKKRKLKRQHTTRTLIPPDESDLSV